MMRRVGGGGKKSEIFLICALFLFFSRLGICTIARRAYRWRKIPTSLFFFAVFRRVKNQKHSIDGQAMKGKKLSLRQVEGLKAFESFRGFLSF